MDADRMMQAFGAGRVVFGALCNAAPRVAAASVFEQAEDMETPAARSFAALTGSRAATLGVIQAFSPSLPAKQRRSLLLLLAAMDGYDAVASVVRNRALGRTGPAVMNGGLGAVFAGLEVQAALAR